MSWQADSTGDPAEVDAAAAIGIPAPARPLLAMAYLVVVTACFVTRGWFEAMRDWRVATFEARLTR